MKTVKEFRTAVSAPNLKAVHSIIILLFILQFIVSSPLVAQEQQSASTKSPVVASTIALAGTTIPIMAGIPIDSNANAIFVSGGLILGPVLGYTYWEQTGIGFKYAATRAVIMGGTFGSMFLICSVGNCEMGLFDNESGDEFGFAVTIGLIGVGATLIHNIVDTFSISRRVKPDDQRVAILPTYFREIKTPGMKVVLSL